MFKKMFGNLMMLALLTIVVTGQGVVPKNSRTPVQGELLARRAAIVDCYQQFGTSVGVKILKEEFDGYTYTVVAVR